MLEMVYLCLLQWQKNEEEEASSVGNRTLQSAFFYSQLHCLSFYFKIPFKTILHERKYKMKKRRNLKTTENGFSLIYKKNTTLNKISSLIWWFAFRFLSVDIVLDSALICLTTHGFQRVCPSTWNQMQRTFQQKSFCQTISFKAVFDLHCPPLPLGGRGPLSSQTQGCLPSLLSSLQTLSYKDTQAFTWTPEERLIPGSCRCSFRCFSLNSCGIKICGFCSSIVTRWS